MRYCPFQLVRKESPVPLASVHRLTKALTSSVYFLFALLVAFHCYRNPMLDIDLLGFAGNVGLTDTSDPAQAHAIVYKEPLTPHLRGADADHPQARILRRRAIVSALCFLGHATAVWGYTRSVLAVLILILPECMVLGQANEADGMSVMLFLFGLWAVFMKVVKLGILPLIAAVWVRTDNAILCLMVRWRSCGFQDS